MHTFTHKLTRPTDLVRSPRTLGARPTLRGTLARLVLHVVDLDRVMNRHFVLELRLKREGVGLVPNV